MSFGNLLGGINLRKAKIFGIVGYEYGSKVHIRFPLYLDLDKLVEGISISNSAIDPTIFVDT